MKSWKTTITGIITIITAACGAIMGVVNGTPVDWTVVIAAVVSGVGLITARDNKVTSEDAGAK
jgi:hypothetical protein